jgi:hypothetical protein
LTREMINDDGTITTPAIINTLQWVVWLTNADGTKEAHRMFDITMKLLVATPDAKSLFPK